MSSLLKQSNPKQHILLHFFLALSPFQFNVHLGLQSLPSPPFLARFLGDDLADFRPSVCFSFPFAFCRFLLVLQL
jgi:hypothetical protein